MIVSMPVVLNIEGTSTIIICQPQRYATAEPNHEYLES